MATHDKPNSAPQPGSRPPPAAPSQKTSAHPDFYDTQFIVGRLKDDQRKSRFRFYMGIVLLALVIVGLYTLTARRAEAPKTLKTAPVVVPATAPAKAPPAQPSTTKPGHRPTH